MPQHADNLSLLQAQIVYKKRLEAMMTELRSQEASLQEKVTELKEKLILEQQDVERLEGRSLAVFIYHAMGKMDEMLDRERREAYATQVKYDAAIRELDAIQEDIRETEADLQDLCDCEDRYARKLEEKRQTIEVAGTPNAEVLLEKERALACLQEQERELEEAIDAGTAALEIISHVLSNLNSAKDWSHFDILGGKFLSDIVKHESLDEAQKNIEQLQIQLQRFNKELSDVSIRSDLQASIDQMLKFADYYFDGLLTDLTAMDRINEAHDQADTTQEEILSILRHLQTALEDNRSEQAACQEEINALVLSAGL